MTDYHRKIRILVSDRLVGVLTTNGKMCAMSGDGKWYCFSLSNCTGECLGFGNTIKFKNSDDQYLEGDL